MERSRIARRFAAAAFAFQAGLALTVWGAAGAKASPASCDGVTGHLVDHGTTVTAVFDVPTTCEEVSVLSWFAAGPHGEHPQVFLDRIGHDNVAPGHYEWTIAAPPPECFRQLDLRVPGRNVDSIVGGQHRCAASSPTTTSPTTSAPPPRGPTTIAPSTTAPTTTAPTTTAPPPRVPTTIAPSTTAPPVSTTAPPVSTTAPPVSTTASPSTTLVISASTTSARASSSTTVVVAGLVLRPAAPQGELARTGRSLAEVVGIALIGVGLGLGVLIAQEWQRQTRAG
jgi:hypothetical protein